jgi:hypothetical protein
VAQRLLNNITRAEDGLALHQLQSDKLMLSSSNLHDQYRHPSRCYISRDRVLHDSQCRATQASDKTFRRAHRTITLQARLPTVTQQSCNYQQEHTQPGSTSRRVAFSTLVTKKCLSDGNRDWAQAIRRGGVYIKGWGAASIAAPCCRCRCAVLRVPISRI